MSSSPNASTAKLPWNSSFLVSSWVVGPLYGINVCVFISCVYVLHMKGLKGPNLMMLIVASVQFALSTGHFITLLVVLVRIYIDEPLQQGSSGATPEHALLEAFNITNSLIGDAILIWRLWIIWNRKFWLCLPFIVLCIATAVTGYTAVVDFVRLTVTSSVSGSSLHNWLVATWALSIATQIGATLLITYRIWISIQWNPTGTRAASRRAVLGTLVESGALYTVSTIFLLGFSWMNVGTIFSGAVGQTSTLAPTLIIARSGLKSLGSPENGSFNNTYHSPLRDIPLDLESRRRECEAMVVHIKEATEIRLDDELAHRNSGGSA